ncbi:hypothetical protein WICMUC_004205 [Wickerhamomyces mucosus]|uniref:AAA+ ATPase domain-containing protein n=1 Tax=Wickerhamomyces mucosus TaxID=1378264 RepID=A0A9P8PJ70_9ASCO|nr:hypothetical protein WICMUC_004205 [Wickerhamomyces mucosus]
MNFIRKKPQISLLDELTSLYSIFATRTISNLELEKNGDYEKALKGWKSIHTQVLFKLDLINKNYPNHDYTEEELSIKEGIEDLTTKCIINMTRVEELYLQNPSNSIKKQNLNNSANSFINYSVPTLRSKSPQSFQSRQQQHQQQQHQLQQQQSSSKMLKTLRSQSNNSKPKPFQHHQSSTSSIPRIAANNVSNSSKPTNWAPSKSLSNFSNSIKSQDKPINYNNEIDIFDQSFEDNKDHLLDFNIKLEKRNESLSHLEAIGKESQISRLRSSPSSKKNEFIKNDELFEDSNDNYFHPLNFEKLQISNKSTNNQHFDVLNSTNKDLFEGFDSINIHPPNNNNNDNDNNNNNKILPSSTSRPPIPETSPLIDLSKTSSQLSTTIPTNKLTALSSSSSSLSSTKPTPVNKKPLTKVTSNTSSKPVTKPISTARIPTKHTPKPLVPKATISKPISKPVIASKDNNDSSSKPRVRRVVKQQEKPPIKKSTSTKPIKTTTTTTTANKTSNSTNKIKQDPLKPSKSSNVSRSQSPDKSDLEVSKDTETINSDSSNDFIDDSELSEKELFAKMEDQIISEVKGIDYQAAKQIFNEIVVRGDEVHWDDIAGLETAKNSLKETVVYPFLRPDLFSGLREPARGMLLFGPPGTGKTMLARAVATESKSTFFSISASSLTSKYLGESEKLVRALFLLARKLSPSIIFVDEIDSILSSRSENGENESSRRIKNEFLIQWSNLTHAAAGNDHGEDLQRVLVLAATNLPWSIDEAARRRFVRRQYIPLPEDETRSSHVQKLMKFQNHSMTDEELSKLVELTDGYSGSDITALAKDAAMGPLRSLGDKLLFTEKSDIRPIELQDFEKSLKYIRPSVSKENLKEFDDWAAKFGSSGV